MVVRGVPVVSLGTLVGHEFDDRYSREETERSKLRRSLHPYFQIIGKRFKHCFNEDLENTSSRCSSSRAYWRVLRQTALEVIS